MLSLKVPKKEAEKAKNLLYEKALFDEEHRVFSDQDFVYFPVKKRFKTRYAFVEKKLEKRDQSKLTLREALISKLSERELEHLKTAYDSVGEIAILEIEPALVKKEKLIAEILLKINKNIKTVLKKAEHHGGVFRTQKLKYLAGKNTKVAEYKENNVKLKLDVEKVYFSIRLSTERKRIAKQVKKGESILVMFSGCAHYPIVLSKNTQAKEIIGVEINPAGHMYALQNLKLNRINNVKLYCGDVRKLVPKMNEKFDRILMPLPKSAENYLDVALKAAKKGATIHFYDFLHENEFCKAEEKIKRACKKLKIKPKILRTVRCGQHSPRIFRICVDFKI